MSVSANYSQPVAVDGYLCWNCHQVAEAKKGVNPDSPASAAGTSASSSPAVLFGGALAQSPGTPAGTATSSSTAATTARALDIFA
jgi:hypothetical protein